MEHYVKVRDVSLDYTVYSVRAQSIRTAMLDLAVGGKLMRSKNDIVSVRALRGINFNLEDGDRLAILGHNGSGKTSLLKVLAGIYEASTGAVEIGGKVTSTISLTSGLDVEASGLENVRNLAMMRLIPRLEVEAKLPSIIDFSALGSFIHLPVKTYSAGMLTRLMFSVVTAFDADVLVIDEWLSAGDAEFVAKASDRMHSFVDQAKIMILATHDGALVRSVCNKVLHLDGGEQVFFGTLDEYHKHKF